MANDRLPLFPLQAVLLPEEILPLHIFEERYKEMIGMCLDENLPFGVVLIEESGIRQIGCTARITEVIQKFPDGRMNIVTQGEKRFRIHQTYDEKSYLTADIEFFGDVGEEAPSANLANAELVNAKLVNEIIEAFRAEGGNPDILSEEITKDAARLSFKIGAALKLPLPDKQALLESNSREDRLRSLVRLIEEQKHRAGRIPRRHEDTSLNGHPKKPGP
jgi:Lon protease-like protein